MKLTHTIDVDRRPDQVFEILERTPDLVGTTFRETITDGDGSTELQGVVTACRPNQEIAFHLDGQYSEVDVDYRLDEVGGRTRLTMHAEVRFKGFLGAAAATLREPDRANVSRLRDDGAARRGPP